MKKIRRRLNNKLKTRVIKIKIVVLKRIDREVILKISIIIN